MKNQFSRIIARSLLAMTCLVSVSLVGGQPQAEAMQEKSGAGQDDTVLLITAEELKDAWKPFADWKTKIGKRTKIVTVDQIKKEFPEKLVQESIRKYVRRNIEKRGTKFVVLGGDCLPGGKGLVPGGHTTFHRQERRGIPTDIVYISPTSWDANGNGKFGEFPADLDEVTYPDGSIGLGRIPVRTEKDVRAFTEKVIAYESDYPTNEFAKSMIYTCTDAPAYPKVRNSWDGYLSKVWDGKMQRYFSQKTPWDEEGKPGSFPLSPKNLVNLINKKEVGKFHIHGHGHLPAWVLEGHSRFTGRHISKLKNKGAYPLFTTVSCNTGEYDSKKDPSIIEAMIRKPEGGSVAVVAPIRTGKPHFAKRSDFRLMVTEGKLDGTTKTMTRYWSGGLGEGLTTGQALMKAKSQMESEARKAPGYHLCICELNLLGDPTLDMRAKVVKTPTLEVPSSVSSGKQKIALKSSAPGATICVKSDSGFYSVTKADGTGNAEVEFDGKPGQKLTVSISGPSLNAVVKEISVK